MSESILIENYNLLQSTTYYAAASLPFSISLKHIICVQISMIACDSCIDCSNVNICKVIIRAINYKLLILYQTWPRKISIFLVHHVLLSLHPHHNDCNYTTNFHVAPKIQDKPSKNRAYNFDFCTPKSFQLIKLNNLNLFKNILTM